MKKAWSLVAVSLGVLAAGSTGCAANGYLDEGLSDGGDSSSDGATETGSGAGRGDSAVEPEGSSAHDAMGGDAFADAQGTVNDAPEGLTDGMSVQDSPSDADQVIPCGPSTCTAGCCGADGQCHTDEGSSTCGTGGTSCKTCSGGLTCGAGGACVASCPAGETSKPDSSGKGAGSVCCASAATTLNCDGTCVNTLVDSSNCGSCGDVCSAAAPTCSSGTCGVVCPSGETAKSDSSGKGAGSVCCAPAPTTLNCDGTCADTLVDSSNCGGCGNVCSAATPSCSSGTCALVCPSGQTAKSDSSGVGAGNACCASASTTLNCDGTCANTLVDSNNCGSCGNACALSTSCNAGVCAFACGGTMYTPSTTFPDGTYELLSSAGFALDDSSGGGAGTGLDQFFYEGHNQQWTVTSVGGGGYKILAANGLALTGQGLNTQVELEPYTGSSQQLFAFVPAGSYWNIVNISSCYALDDNQGGGYQHSVLEWTFTPGDASQIWTLTPTSSITPPVASGTYEITANSGYVLDDPSGGGSGTVPDQWAYMGNNEQWTVTNVSGVEYEITNANTGLALTQTSTPNTTMAGLATYNSSSPNDQLWIFWPTGSGSSYYLVNVGTGMAMDDNNSGGVGVQLDQWTWSGTSHQYWTLTPTSTITAPLPNGSYVFTDTGGYALDDPSGGATSTPDQVAPANGNQRWTITNISGVEYKIVGSGGDALTSGASSGSSCSLSAYTGATNQLWTVWPNGTNYSVLNVGTGLALDSGSGSSGSLARVKIWAANTNQTWTIAPPTPSVPVGLTATAATSTSISLNWNASSEAGGTISGYSVYVNGSLSTAVAGTSATVSGLTAGTSYSFTVASVDSNNRASAQCSPVTTRIHSNGVGQYYPDSSALNSYTATTAAEACAAYAAANPHTGYSCQSGIYCNNDPSATQVCYENSQNSAGTDCWGYAGDQAGNAENFNCPPTVYGTWN